MAKLIAVWACLFIPVHAIACFCVDSTSFEDHARSGEFHIFKGVVVKNWLDTNIVSAGKPFVATTFEVEIDYTDLEGPIFCHKYTVRQAWTNCDKHFALDSAYVVFSPGMFQGFMGTNSCTPTSLFSQLSAEEVESLGEGNRDFEDCRWRDHWQITDPEGEDLPNETIEPEEAALPALTWVLMGIIAVLLLMVVKMQLKLRKRKG